MSNVSLGKKRFEGKTLGLLLGAAVLLSPLSTYASVLLPSQVLPPQTGKSCAPVTVSDISAHVYDQKLDSFDVTLSDSTYIAVSTTVGEQMVPFNYISRWSNPDGSVKMHVDLQSIRMDRDVKVQITFLSAHTEEGGRVTCIFNVPATIEAVAAPAETPSTGGTTSTGGTKPATGTTKPGTESPNPTTPDTNPALVSAMSSLGNLCADGGSSRLWVVLLVLYAIFAFTLCAQNFEAGPNVRQWNIGLMLAIFAGLLVFWYISALCRTGPWAPALATLIAIAGLLYTMLKPGGTNQILLLKDGKK